MSNQKFFQKHSDRGRNHLSPTQHDNDKSGKPTNQHSDKPKTNKTDKIKNQRTKKQQLTNKQSYN